MFGMVKLGNIKPEPEANPDPDPDPEPEPEPESIFNSLIMSGPIVMLVELLAFDMLAMAGISKMKLKYGGHRERRYCPG